MALADVERCAALDLGEGGRAPRLNAAAAVLGHCLALIDAAGPACVAVKPQLACFERLGFAGWLALEATVGHARAQGLLVIADAKRGDIDASARAYAQAVFAGIDTPFGPSPGLGADAVTLNPLLGRDALAPFVDAAHAAGAGAFVLVRTSNPGAADLFDLELAAGGPLWERLAGLVAAAGRPGPESGLSRDRRGHRGDGAAAPGAHARADAAHPLPAPRHRRPGRQRRRPGARVRTGSGGRAGQRVALDRRRARDRRRPRRARPRAPRRSACASRPGRSPEHPPPR